MSARMLVMVMLLFHAVAAVSAELGRMFFTPAQRDTLDAARAKNIRVELDNENPPPPPAVPAPRNVSINGMVRRSDGPGTVWLNNRPVTGRQAEGLGVTPSRSDSRVRLSVPQGRSIDLKVGQTAEIVSGRVEEGYARRGPSRSAVKAGAGAEVGAPAAGTVPASAVLPQVDSGAALAKRLPSAGGRDVEGQNRGSFPLATETVVPGAEFPGGNYRNPQ